MMKKYLEKTFRLSESGAKGLNRAVWSFFFYYFSFVPPMIIVFHFADNLIYNRPLSSWFYLAFLIIATLVMYFIVNYNFKVTYTETYNESENLRIDIAEKLSKLPLSYFSKHNLSDLAQTIMSDVAAVEHAMANSIGNFIGFILYFAVMSVMFLVSNFKLGLCVIIPIVISAAFLFATRSIQVRDVNKHYDKMRAVAESFQNVIELNHEIQSYGLKDSVKKDVNQTLSDSLNLQWRAQITQSIPITIGQTVSILPVGITFIVGLNMFINGEITILVLIAFIVLAAKMSGSVTGILLFIVEIFYIDARTEKIGEIKDHETQHGVETVLNHYDIEVSNVDFSYHDGTKVINNVSFNAAQGQVTALVGPSGCGKTTMLKLISRLYDVDSGSIKIDGQDIKEIDTECLFKYISIVFQDVVLFNASIMENIRIGNLNASDEEVIKAAKLAGCDEFVMKLPDKYETLIGENGAKLSGGERQRLSIARAILKNAPIIILDEIASSLDVETEIQIQDSLNHLIQGKTVIIISHRLKSIENVDKIVVLNGGHVEASGTHSELLEKSPTYKNMIKKSRMAEEFNY